MSQEFKITPVSIRPTKDFKPLPELGRPGGTKEGQASSNDIQFFQETSTGTRWIGKCGASAMTKPAELQRMQRHYEAQYKHARYFDEYREAVALMLYRLLGVTTPAVAVSLQLPAKVSAKDESDLSDTFDYHTPCLHLMSQFVTDFQVLGKPFIAAYQQQSDLLRPTTVITPTGETLPLKGLGAALAVGCFLHDADCLGGGGANMGYVVQTDPDGQRYAQLVKIDAGAAFIFLGGDTSIIYTHDPRKRNMFFGLQNEFILRYDQLSASDQAEFAQTAKAILQVPRATFKAVIDQGIAADGFTPSEVDHITNELVARKSLFLNGFAPEVNGQLKAEVKAARETVLAGLLAKTALCPPTSPQQKSKHTASSQTSLLPDTKQGLSVASSTISSSSSSSVVSPVLRSGAGIESNHEDEVVETKQGRAPANSSHTPFHASAVRPLTHVRSQTPAEIKENNPREKSTVSPQRALFTWGGNSADPTKAFLAQQDDIESKTIRLAAQLEKERIKGEKPDDKTGCQVFQKPAVSAYFTGRETMLASIAEQLHRGQGSAITQGINGLGGVGKTQLAARYAQLASEGASCGGQQLQYQAVVWLNAEHNLDIQFLMLAEAWCNKTGLKPEEAVIAVYRYLQNKRTLLVFDNAVDQASIAPFLPPTKHSLADRFKRTFASNHSLHILITSRNADWQGVPTLSVSGFSMEEATTFVRQRLAAATPAQTTTAEQVNALLETVSTLPLALSHAVAYIAEGHCTIQDYPKQFALHQLSLGGTITQTDASHTVLTTFLLTLFRVKQQHPVVVPILQACAYLAPEGIQTAWLETALAGPEDAKGGYKLGRYPLPAVQAGLVALQRHALLQVEKPGSLAMHRLLQQVIRHQLTAAEQQDQIGRVLQWLTAVNPEDDSLATEQIQRALLPHLQAVITHHEQSHGAQNTDLAIALGQAGNIYQYLLGQPAKSRALLERALAVFKTLYESERYQAPGLLINLGNAYGELGDVAKQRELLERSLKIQEAHYGPEHYEVAMVLTNLGTAYGGLGDVAKQRELLERALKIQEAHYGPEHYKVALTLMNLGNAYGDLGDAAKKRALLERALKIQEAHYGPEYYKVALTLMNLGTAYGGLGDAAKQRELLERALKIQEAHYGPEHYQVAIVLTNLGAAYGGLGNAAKKRELLERALAIGEAHYGPEHYQVAMVLTNLGNAYGGLGDVRKKRELLERALKIQEAHYGPEHYQVALTLMNLGNAYGGLGNAAKKRELLERALAIGEAHYGPEHYQVAIVLTNLGAAYGELGDASKARDALERALAIQETYYGPEHYQVAMTLMNLGTAYGELGDVRKKRELLERALAIGEAHYGPQHYEVAGTLTNLGDAYLALGEVNKACSALERALVIKKARYGQSHPEVAVILMGLALVYHVLKQSAVALQAAQRCYQILINHPDYGPAHPTTKQCLEALRSSCGFTSIILQSKIAPEPLTTTSPTTLSSENKSIGEMSPLPVSSTPLELEQLQNLYQTASLCLMEGNLDKVIEVYETALKHTLPVSDRQCVLHNLACVYHVRSRQQQNKDDWLRAKQLFEKAVAVKSLASTYCEYAQFLYLKGVEQPQKGWFEQAVMQLMLAFTADEEGGLSYSWSERETVPACLRSLLSKPEDAFEISPRLLAQYLLVSCYCHLNRLPEAETALSELEKGASGQGTASLAHHLLTTARAEYAKCQQAHQKGISDAKISNPSDVHLREKTELVKPSSLPTEKETRHVIPTSPHIVTRALESLDTTDGELDELANKRALLEHTLAIDEAHYGRDHHQLAKTLIKLSTAYGELGDMAKKVELVERALKIQEVHYGPTYPGLVVTLTNLATAYHKLKQDQLALQAAQRCYQILIGHPSYGARHPMTEQCLQMLQSTCGFTVAMLQSGNTVREEKKSAASSHTTTTSSTSSSAQLLSQHGLASSGIQQAQQRLGHSALALLVAINSQRKPGWEPQAHVSFTATVLNALAEGKQAFKQLCTKPEQHQIPVELAEFIQTYVAQHPDLHELSTYPGFARSLAKDIGGGKLDTLYARFGAPKPEQKATAASSKQEEVSCFSFCSVM